MPEKIKPLIFFPLKSAEVLPIGIDGDAFES